MSDEALRALEAAVRRDPTRRPELVAARKRAGRTWPLWTIGGVVYGPGDEETPATPLTSHVVTVLTDTRLAARSHEGHPLVTLRTFCGRVETLLASCARIDPDAIDPPRCKSCRRSRAYRERSGG